MTEQMSYHALIGGKKIDSGETLTATSPFYREYEVKLPNLGQVAIDVALSKASNVYKECQSISPDQRLDILQRAAKKLTFPNEELEYSVRMKGMPIIYVKKHLGQIPNILTKIPEMINEKFEIRNGHLMQRAVPDSDMYEVRDMCPGYVYLVTPGNDDRASAIACAYLTYLGIPAIIRPSKNNFPIEERLAETIVNEGYPGLQVVYFGKMNLHFNIVDRSRAIWAYGDDNTVNNLLRYEHRTTSKGVEDIDHFSEKLVFAHKSGRTAGVVDDTASEIATQVLQSAFEYPIGCNATKSLFVSDNVFDELEESLISNTDELGKFAGDPMNLSTKVGLIEKEKLFNPKRLSVPEEMPGVLNRVEELSKPGLLQVKTGGKLLNDYQATPLLATTNDVNSEFLSTEPPIYMLTLKKCGSFHQALEELNMTSGEGKRLIVTIFSSDNEKEKGKIGERKIHAHHVRLSSPKHPTLTTELDLLFHEGHDYLRELTELQVRRG